MSPLPLPVRVAAGLVASAVEQARELPRRMIELPVTAVSHVLQTSMRVQQTVTELAIKGDRVLGTLRRPEENPAWATFDDEIVAEPPAPASRNGARPAGDLWPAEEPFTGPGISTDDTDPDAEAAEAEVPEVLPGYPGLTIPQLRGRLRFLSVEDLRALLAWETAHENRPPYVTMLANRITTVTEG